MTTLLFSIIFIVVRQNQSELDQLKENNFQLQRQLDDQVRQDDRRTTPSKGFFSFLDSIERTIEQRTGH